MSDQADGMGRMRGAEGLALTLRFVLEIGAVAALAWWGIKVGTDDLSRAGLAIFAAVLFIVVWALVVAPKARNPLSPMTRWLIGTGLLLLAVVALWTVGPVELAILFGILVVLDTAALLWFDFQRPPGG